ncbi:MAG: 23S rRNA (guanosine(2251)-2'-O)-methyltransferase RlmB [Kyrpidia sp.]|nr:23S rRNA (guanosine(2251)-2'-O)-methyltransferase RlmB [Kyrpidia sp.]
MKGPNEAREGRRVVGRQPVLELLRAGRPVNRLFVAEGAEGGSIPEIVARAREMGAVVTRVPKRRLDDWVGDVSHQGVMADVAPFAYADLDVLLESVKASGRPGLFVLLDGIEDPHNLGSILRTAEACAVDGVVIPKRRAAAVTETVAKASAGAAEFVPVARVANLGQALVRLTEAGYWAVGADAGGKRAFTDVDYRGPTVLVIGGEGKGLSRLIRERCDEVVGIPMLGRIHSLNAGVAAGVLLYEVIRQRTAR